MDRGYASRSSKVVAEFRKPTGSRQPCLVCVFLVLGARATTLATIISKGDGIQRDSARIGHATHPGDEGRGDLDGFTRSQAPIMFNWGESALILAQSLLQPRESLLEPRTGKSIGAYSKNKIR